METAPGPYAPFFTCPVRLDFLKFTNSRQSHEASLGPAATHPEGVAQTAIPSTTVIGPGVGTTCLRRTPAWLTCCMVLPERGGPLLPSCLGAPLRLDTGRAPLAPSPAWRLIGVPHKATASKIGAAAIAYAHQDSLRESASTARRRSFSISFDVRLLRRVGRTRQKTSPRLRCLGSATDVAISRQ